MAPSRRRRRFRIPRSTLFVLLGLYLLVNEVAIADRAPNPSALLAGLLLIGAIPIEVVERILRRSVLSDEEDQP